MVRTSFRLCSLVALAFISQSSARAQDPNVYDLLPESAQAVVWIADSDDLMNRWNRTSLHQLANDPTIRPFFAEQQEAIQNRMMEAGWRLGVKPQDLADYFEGQLAVAWLEKPDVRKPFAIVLFADVDDDAATTKKMFAEIDEALAQHKPGRKELSHLDQVIVQYTMPRRPGQLLAESTFLSVVSGKLLISDELLMVQDLISKLEGQEVAEKSLAEDSDFIASREHLSVSGKAQLEYFIRPLGIARVIRAISGKRSKNNADILAVLKNQGFTSIKCISGEVWVAEAESDIAHRGFVLAEFPLPRSAAILDFPNESMTEVPSFVTNRAASYFATSWNAQTAFWKARELVDELIGNEGVFDEVIHGIKNDVNGPQVDIRNELLPLMTNDIVAVVDNQDGEVEVNSRRNLFGLKVNDSAKAARILDRVMLVEANAELLDYQGVGIWKVTNEKNSDEIDDFSEFGDFDEDDADSEDPWLNQWAICVLHTGDKEGYFLFASHTDMLEEAIAQSQSDGTTGLQNEKDYQRIHSAIMQLMDSENPCAWKISRNHLALRVQYELFRQGKLEDSESMMASILNRIIGSDDESADSPAERTFSGDSLPPFESIADFLNPSGIKIRATEDGWEFGGMMLGPEKDSSAELSGSEKEETARVVDSINESNR